MIIIILLTIILLCCCFLYKRKQINNEIIKQNKEIEENNKILLKQQSEYKLKLENINEQISHENNILADMIKSVEELKEQAKEEARKVYEAEIEKSRIQLEEHYERISAAREIQLNSIDDKIKQSAQKLQDIEAKQLAYIEAIQRQEKINKQQDYYRLVITEDDKADIELLRDTQKRLIKKESVDKIIYDTYYKPAYDVLMSHIFGNKTKISGIYKLTDLITKQAYIGQSVDCRERARQHIKNSLTSGKASNKLYQQMQESGPFNFTFELLEEVPKEKLNEREAYWINFYKTKEFGLNSTKGNN